MALHRDRKAMGRIVEMLIMEVIWEVLGSLLMTSLKIIMGMVTEVVEMGIVSSNHLWLRLKKS